MSTHKNFDRLCVVAVLLALLLSLLLVSGVFEGITQPTAALGYEQRLFSTDKVHTIDIRIDNWESFLETCQSEEYSLCDLVIDGEAVNNVGIRGKGNTSLSTVATMDSDRYSFKIEFDQYDSSHNYYGLDKLCLNNLIQDNTYMKDYLTYRLMALFGVNAPLCSFVDVSVNGESWGLYLAVEGIEDAFIARNYGSNPGELYKPDSMSMGGGRGNGKEFSMSQFENLEEDVQMPADKSQRRGDMGMGMNMGASDVKLQYIDDDPDSYSNIFSSAKTAVTSQDQQRLIESLRQLSSFENIDRVVDIDQVLRYFVVHNFVVNGDSYTGSMIHNYYLYEEDGQLSMIPWDYNLAFGTFQGGSAASSVNAAIDEVLSDRPMQAWIFSDEAYTREYYDLYETFISETDISGLILQTKALIADYVKQDPTAFCTYEEFETGVDTLLQFCSLRSESVRNQLDGQKANVDVGTLNLSAMGTMNMGGKGNMQMPQMGENMQWPGDGQMQLPEDMTMPQRGNRDSMTMTPERGGKETSQEKSSTEGMTMPEGMTIPEGMTMPAGMELPQNMAFPENFAGNMGSAKQPTDLFLLAASLLVLILGLLIAWRYRR